MANPRATLAVLAGGEGARMGRAKGLIEIGGKPILEYLLAKWKWPGRTMLVTAPGREHPPGWERFTCEVVDPVTGQGPLRGVLTALEAATTELVVVATCDMPLVGREQLVELVDYLSREQNRLGAMWRWYDRRGERLEPFPGGFRRSAAPLLDQRLNTGQLSMQSLSQLAEVSVLPAKSEWSADIWTNLNRPDELATFLNSRL